MKPIYDAEREARMAEDLDIAFGRKPYQVVGFTIVARNRRGEPQGFHFTFKTS